MWDLVKFCHILQTSPKIKWQGDCRNCVLEVMYTVYRRFRIDQKFRKFRVRNRMQWKFSRKKFRKFGYTLRGCPNVPENRNNRKIMFHLICHSYSGPISLAAKSNELNQARTSWTWMVWNGLVQPTGKCCSCHMKFSELIKPEFLVEWKAPALNVQ